MRSVVLVVAVALSFLPSCLFGQGALQSIESAKGRMSEAKLRYYQDVRDRVQYAIDATKISLSKERPQEFVDATSKLRVGSMQSFEIPGYPGDILPASKLQVGDIGFGWQWKAEVVSIVDSDNLILRTQDDQDIWLQGYPTLGLTDSQKIAIIDPVIVVKPSSYQTVTGARRTIPTITILGEEDYKKYLTAKAESERAIEEAKEKSLYDDLKLKTGNSFRAKLVSVEKQKLSFIADDGSKKTFYLNAFEDKSRSILENRISELKKQQEK